MRHFREAPLWRDVTDEQWASWKWQVSHRLRRIEELEALVELTAEERAGILEATAAFPLSITPYYASLMDPVDPTCPVRRLAVPTSHELQLAPEEQDDPLDEQVDAPVPLITHRYPDRVLFLITDMCSMYCRHCTRRHFTGEFGHAAPRARLDEAIDYIRRTPQVRDVLLSGGDALLVGDAWLEYIISRLRAIDHVEIVRLGTRMPVVCPQRITPELCAMLRKYHPIYVNTHFNHPKEVTAAAAEACGRLADAGIPLGNQVVLLRGINDCPVVMKSLMHACVRIRVRPYYIYQCDLSPGLSHFRTSIAKGMEIMEMLRGHTTGFAVPTYVVDAPGGGGKIPVMPNYVISMAEGKVILRNYEGVISVYTEPPADRRGGEAPCPLCASDHRELGGIGELFYGRRRSLEPEGIERRRRSAGGHAHGVEGIADPTVHPRRRTRPLSPGDVALASGGRVDGDALPAALGRTRAGAGRQPADGEARSRAAREETPSLTPVGGTP
jgi:lysine 2,3-aminomutase